MRPKLFLAAAAILGSLTVSCVGPERAEYREGCHAYCTTSDYALPPDTIACLDQRAYRCGVATCANGKGPTLDRCGGGAVRCDDGTEPRCEADRDAGVAEPDAGSARPK